MSCKQVSRTAFSRQPAHYLLFDIGYPMTSDLINNVILAVKNVLLLGNSSRGSNRVPAFGLASINEQFQNILSPEIVRGNFVTISKAFTDLSNQAKFSKKLSPQDYKDHLYMAINILLEDFKSTVDVMLNSNRQFPSQLQITLVTAKNDTEIEQCVQKAVQDKNILKLKKVQTRTNVTNSKEATLPNKKLSKEHEFVTIIHMLGEQNELENVFKEWLLDSNNDHEHLHIVFPATSNNSTPPLLKCDIDECLINPLSIPFGHRFQIQPDFCSIQLGGSGITTDDQA
ncbi:hypothetical protein C0J52_12233 [Blattella germanica]|nr:hypothetical protein C0J52_12233 [Blattella germanica]